MYSAEFETLTSELQEAKTEESFEKIAKRASIILKEDSEFWLFRGLFFQNVDNPFFEPSHAEFAFTQAARMNDFSAVWRLAIGYRYGFFGRVDVELYSKYRNAAYKLGNPGAASQYLSDLILS